MTPYSDVNPNYVIYDIGKTSYVTIFKICSIRNCLLFYNFFQNVLDYESWIYNLTKANINVDGPQWFKLYSFKEQFKLQNLSLFSLDDLLHRFAGDSNFLLQYWKLKMKHGDPIMHLGCDKKCQTQTICDIVVNEIGDNKKCDYFTNFSSLTL